MIMKYVVGPVFTTWTTYLNPSEMSSTSTLFCSACIAITWPLQMTGKVCKHNFWRHLHISCVILRHVLRSLFFCHIFGIHTNGMTQTTELYSIIFRDYILWSMSYQQKARLVWSQPSLLLVWFDNDLKTCFSMTWLICVCNISNIMSIVHQHSFLREENFVKLVCWWKGALGNDLINSRSMDK